MIIDICTLYAATPAERRETVKARTTREITLDIMYKNIPGLQAAKLDTKNYIYDTIKEIIDKYNR